MFRIAEPGRLGRLGLLGERREREGDEKETIAGQNVCFSKFIGSSSSF